MTDTFYKVARVQPGATVARPCHGGSLSFSWPLPTDEPGAWVEVDGPIALCESGLHLTREPIRWWINDPEVRLFEAEYDGELIDGGEKVCVRKARLVREVDWAGAPVFRSGEHHVTSGQALAYGSATVEASGSATVRAYSSARVRAYGSAMVEAYGSAMVEAYGSAMVESYGSATVEASGLATVLASGSVRVWASGSATVVSTHGHATTAQVVLSQMAVHIDRRDGKLAIRDGLGRTLEPMAAHDSDRSG